MEIRRAENKDIPAISHLLDQVGQLHYEGRPDLFRKGTRKYQREQLEEMLQEDTKAIFVAVENEIVVGYVICVFECYLNHNILTDVKTLYIDDLCIDENQRGKHIGRQLYDYVVDFAKKSGCYNVTLNVWSENTSALKFYESCGLKPQKVHMEMIL